MQSAKSTTWPHLRSRPRRHETRVVEHEARRQASRPDLSVRASIAELPPPGPSNIIVRTANPLPAPRNIESQ
jgi:hypothetical protein